MPEDWEAGGFGLYVHWPWCQAKCPYCDFNSHVTARIDQEVWAQAYAGQIARAAEETGPRILRSIFFGGGTPSLMAPAVVEAVIGAAQRGWQFANDIEITLEANPTSVEADRFEGYRAAGVNRVSLGVQALRDPDLRRLGRLHTAAEALAAVDLAGAVFPRVSMDLIYARQDQGLADWEAELAQALALGLEHLSLYQLTIEDGTAFGARHAAGGLTGLPDEDLAADLFDMTQDMTQAAGVPAYEISNHARPGAESRHNLIYWRSGDWIGIGPGAHGRLTLGNRREARAEVREPLDWLRRARDAADSGAEVEILSDQARLAELAVMGLRLREGLAMDLFCRMGGDIYLSNIKVLREDGLIETGEGRLAVTDKGRPLLNAVLGRLLADQPPDKARSRSSS